MGLIGTNENRIEGPQRIGLVPHPNLSSTVRADHHVRMMMSLKAGKTSGFQLEIANVEIYLLALVANQHLSRCAAKLATRVGRYFVGFQLGLRPSEIGFEAPHRWRLSHAQFSVSTQRGDKSC